MPRAISRPTGHRVTTPAAISPPEQYRISTTGAEAQSYSAVSIIASGVLGRLSAAANGVTQDRLQQQNREDLTKGAQQRTQETVDGTAAQPEDALASYTPAFRRGYYLTEASNKIDDARRSLVQRVAQMDVGEDAQPVIQETLGDLMKQREFQDPQVMAQLQPKVDQVRAQVLDVRQKSETAELLERQSENVNTMLRSAALDGSLLAPGGLERAAAALDTPEFAYVTQDEFYDSASAQIEDVLASGEGNLDKLTTFLQNTKDASGVPLWDRKTPNGGN